MSAFILLCIVAMEYNKEEIYVGGKVFELSRSLINITQYNTNIVAKCLL